MTDKQKQQYVKEYIRSLKAIEDAMEPYKEQRRELRSEFKENGWLNTDTILDNLDIIQGSNSESAQ